MKTYSICFVDLVYYELEDVLLWYWVYRDLRAWRWRGGWIGPFGALGLWDLIRAKRWRGGGSGSGIDLCSSAGVWNYELNLENVSWASNFVQKCTVVIWEILYGAPHMHRVENIIDEFRIIFNGSTMVPFK